MSHYTQCNSVFTLLALRTYFVTLACIVMLSGSQLHLNIACPQKPNHMHSLVEMQVSAQYTTALHCNATEKCTPQGISRVKGAVARLYQYSFSVTREVWNCHPPTHKMLLQV